MHLIMIEEVVISSNNIYGFNNLTIFTSGTGVSNFPELLPNSILDSIKNSAITESDIPLTVNVSDNDTDAESDSLTVIDERNFAKGSIEIVDDQVIYTLNAGFIGTEIFFYRISDGKDDTDTVQVTVDANLTSQVISFDLNVDEIQTISTNQGNNSNFQIIDNTIYDPNGQEFIIKGANMFAWEGIENVHNYLNIWGFNTIRVPNYLLGSYNQPHPADNDYRINHKIVDAYTSQGATVIFDAHDRIGGYYEDQNWEVLKDYWREMAQEFKDNPYVWFNLHNEPGNHTTQADKWVDYHRELIDIIRAEGANNMIIVDGEAWGQDYLTQTIANHAHEVIAGNENIVFSVHVYDQWNSQDLGVYFDSLQAQNIPIIVGEYGSETNNQSTLAATEQMFGAVQEREIGRLVWNAKADDLNDLTTGWKGHAEHFNGTNTEILTELGELVWNDLQQTEDLSQLFGHETDTSEVTFSEGVFEVDLSGEIQVDFLFDGHWFTGELALFNLSGMENYTPGSIEFIQEAASRALSNSQLGYTLIRDSTEKARFTSSFSWEPRANWGKYQDQKTFSLDEGTRFGLMLTQNNKIADVANYPESIWQARCVTNLFYSRS